MTERAPETRILDALDVPRTTREVHWILLRQRWEAWAEEEGVELEYTADGWPCRPFAAALLAAGWEKDRGEALNREQARRVLLRLERMGAVTRIQIPGRRPMLWMRQSPPEALPAALRAGHRGQRSSRPGRCCASRARASGG